MSVPICGLFIYEIWLGAPNLTNCSITVLQSGLCKFVVSLPSEKVPAPPSPNCTLDIVFNIPSFLNSSTSFERSSTFLPCSIIIGFTPFSTIERAQNNPAGPAPIITGLLLLFLDTVIPSNLSCFSKSTTCTFFAFASLSHKPLSLISTMIE